jgi:hypothetical protein
VISIGHEFFNFFRGFSLVKLLIIPLDIIHLLSTKFILHSPLNLPQLSSLLLFTKNISVVLIGISFARAILIGHSLLAISFSADVIQHSAYFIIFFVYFH